MTAVAGMRPAARSRRVPSSAAPDPAILLPVAPVSVATRAMGGRLGVHVDAAPPEAERARRDGRRVLARVGRWADRLSRHLGTSELSRLNTDPRPRVRIGPTLAAVLRAAIDASEASDGLVDIGLLDARLAAEGIRPAGIATEELGTACLGTSARAWSLQAEPRGCAVVIRPPGLRLDLGGVAKGWLADRALDLLDGWPGAVVDADGDLALRAAPGRSWSVAVDDPRASGAALAVLRLSAPARGWPVRWGVATSGTSIHRWLRDGTVRHHLIDPRTGRPAVTDVVQATVVCASALRAEALAKAAVIAGTIEGLALLDRAGVGGAIVLTDHDEVLALPGTRDLLADDGD